MRAIRFSGYGPAEVLTEVELPEPVPGAGEVAIDVEYAGVNFAEVMFRRGQFPVELPHVPGLEATGTVRAVGPGVAGIEVGQRVAALTLAGGGYAEVAVARAELTVPLEGPLAAIPPALAAGFPCNVTVAWGILSDLVRLRAGESLLILAAAGGVGTVAAQIARHCGAGPIFGAVSSADKVDYALRFGYQRVVTYDRLEELAEQAGTGIDVVLDSVGGPARPAALNLLGPLGRQVIFGDAAAADHQLAADTLWFSCKTLSGYNLGELAARRPGLVGEHLRRAALLVAENTVDVDVTELPLGDAVKAHESLEARASTGKYVLRVRG